MNGPFENLSAVALAMLCMNIPSGKNGLPSIRVMPRRSMRTPFVSGFSVRVKVSDFASTFFPLLSKISNVTLLSPSGSDARSIVHDMSSSVAGTANVRPDGSTSRP